MMTPDRGAGQERGPAEPPQVRNPVFAFDQAVDRVAEEAAFLAAGQRHQAARYLAAAHAALSDVRATMHRIEARTSDPLLRKSARRRLHAIAVTVAEAGLRDAERVLQTARHLGSAAPEAVAGGWSATLKRQGARVTAWSVEKWTGSPFAATQLQSAVALKEASPTLERVVRRGAVPARRPSWQRLRRPGLVAGAVGVGSLAAYGAWSLVGAVLGL